MVQLGYLFLIKKENLEKVLKKSKGKYSINDYEIVEPPDEIEYKSIKRSKCLNCEKLMYYTNEKFCDIECKASLYFKLLDLEKKNN